MDRITGNADQKTASGAENSPVLRVRGDLGGSGSDRQVNQGDSGVEDTDNPAVLPFVEDLIRSGTTGMASTVVGSPTVQQGVEWQLDGKTWLRYSISIWNDLVKTATERKFGHPALFPLALTDRLLQIFYRGKSGLVLDPFLGSGSTVCAAALRGIPSVGFELEGEYLDLTRRRLAEMTVPEGCWPQLYQADCRKLRHYLKPESVGLCITSPPYWNILRQRRTADGKEQRNYGENSADLGNIASYDEYLTVLGEVFGQVQECLLPGAYCVVVVMDIRKGPHFYPLHMDLTGVMRQVGLVLDDLVIWDRRQEYNCLRPLGYPHVFRVNKIHEFIMIYQKPAC